MALATHSMAPSRRGGVQGPQGVLGWNEYGRLVKSFPLYFASYSLERWRLYGDWFGGVDLYRRQPAEAIRLEAVGYSVELVGDFLRDFAGLAVADKDAVDRADRRNLRSRTGEEDFVGNVEQFPRNGLLRDREAEMPGDGEHAVAGNAGEGRVCQRRGVEHAVAHHEDVLPRAFAHQPVDVKSNALRVAVDVGFHADELR